MKTLNKPFFKGSVYIKKIISITFLILVLITLPCVSANNNTTEYIPTTIDGNFTELNYEIENSNGTLTLDKNYTDNGEIILNKSISIDGKGYSISNNNSDFKLKINNNLSLILKNITFKNDKIFVNQKNFTVNLTIVDCRFIENIKNNSVSIIKFDINIYKSGNVSETVRKLAIEIAGNSSDLDAVKKIAEWVGKNIKHEVVAGFYQSPDETLKRKLGNCCCQTDLFLQMCDVLNITQNHQVFYVHVGNKSFGQRHFFAMIDDIFVDVDSKWNNPWGNANTLNDEFYKFTQYPLLPLPKTY